MAKVCITQLSANKEKAIPTSAHSQEPRVWSPVGSAHETLTKGSLGKGMWVLGLNQAKPKSSIFLL